MLYLFTAIQVSRHLKALLSIWQTGRLWLWPPLLHPRQSSHRSFLTSCPSEASRGPSQPHNLPGTQGHHCLYLPHLPEKGQTGIDFPEPVTTVHSHDIWVFCCEQQADCFFKIRSDRFLTVWTRSLTLQCFLSPASVNLGPLWWDPSFAAFGMYCLTSLPWLTSCLVPTSGDNHRGLGIARLYYMK